MDTIKYIQDGRVIAEFTTAQAMHDFIVEKTKRECEGERILSEKTRIRKIATLWFVLGSLFGEILFILLDKLTR